MANEIEPIRQTAVTAVSADDLAEKVGRAVTEHRAHFDRHGRAADLAGCLESIASIAKGCGWEEPHHPRCEKMSEWLVRSDKERRRSARLSRRSECADDLRQEIMRLVAEGELADLSRRVGAIMKPAGADLIAQEFAASLAAAPNSPESGPLYVPTVTAALAREGFSMGAVILGLGDVAGASARRFGRAPLEEIHDAIEARETELEDRGEALSWLVEYVAELPAIMAAEQAMTEEAERRRLAAEAKAAEAKRQRDIQDAVSALRKASPADATSFEPDILAEARTRIAAEDSANAERQAEEKAYAERKRAELWGKIAAGDFRSVRWPYFSNFDGVADEFERDPTSTPEQIAALRTFRQTGHPK